jgi:hypothetical protein
MVAIFLFFKGMMGAVAPFGFLEFHSTDLLSITITITVQNMPGSTCTLGPQLRIVQVQGNKTNKS